MTELNIVDLVTDALNAMVNYFLDLALDAFRLIIFNFLETFSLDMTYFFNLFPGGLNYFQVFQIIGISLLIVISAFTIYINMMSPDGKISYFKFVRNMVFAFFLIFYTLNIYDVIFQFGNKCIQLMMEVGNNDVSITIDWIDAYRNIFVNGIDNETLAFLLAIVFTVVIIWNFLKLMMEIIERYIFLCVTMFFFPCASSLIINERTSEVFVTFLKGMLGAVFMCITNQFFVNMAMEAMVGIIAESAADGIIAVFIHCMSVIAILKIAQKIDTYLNSLGLSTARSAANFGGGLMAAAIMLSRGLGMAQRGGFLGGVGADKAARTDYSGKLHETADRAKEANLGAGDKVVKDMDAVKAAGFADSMRMEGKNPCATAGDVAINKMQNSGVVGLDPKEGKSVEAEMMKGQYGGHVQTFNNDGSITRMNVAPLDGPRPNNGFIVNTDKSDYFAGLEDGSAPVGGYGVEEGSYTTLGDANSLSDEGTGGTFNSGVVSGIFGQEMGDDSIIGREGGAVSFYDSSTLNPEESVPLGVAYSPESSEFNALKGSGFGTYYEDKETGNAFVGVRSTEFGPITNNSEFMASSRAAREFTGNMQNLTWSGNIVTDGRAVAQTYDGKKYEFVNPASMKSGFSKGWRKIPISNDKNGAYVLGRDMDHNGSQKNVKTDRRY